jgi:hypothetical protein
MTYHTTPASLPDALDALADRMERHNRPFGHMALANMMSAVVDGPGHTAWQASGHPELVQAVTKAVVPNGFLSPIPTVQQVRQAAAAARTA